MAKKGGKALKFENTPILQMGELRFRRRWQLAGIWSWSRTRTFSLLVPPLPGPAGLHEAPHACLDHVHGALRGAAGAPSPVLTLCDGEQDMAPL